MPTYMISADGESITCLDCGMRSWSQGDVKNLYCGNCHEFHDNKISRNLVKRYFDGNAPLDVVANVEEMLRLMRMPDEIF